MMTKLNLQNLAGGALAERFNLELQQVIQNIADPNTDPDEDRDVAGVSFLIKKGLVPAKAIGTSLVIGHDATGQVAAQELKSGIPGQTFIDEDGDIATDTGEKIVKFQTSKQKAGDSK